jgi:hypothetical protein
VTPKQAIDLKAGPAAARHDAMVAAYDAHQARVGVPKSDAWAGLAGAFKLDPQRPFDALLNTVASYLTPDDTLLDVGGGAGRLCLPLASCCREVVVVDPSAAMGEVFHATAKEAAITNARFIASGWLEADGATGDIALVTHVTYFVPHIAPFIQKLNAATRRRVVVGARSVPPPNQVAPFFRLAHDEGLAPVPGHEELLAVLTEMGIGAELIDTGPAMLPATARMGKTRQDAVRFETEGAVRGGWLLESDAPRMSKLIDERFDELFAETDRGYWRRSAIDSRDLLITWETA